MLFVIGLMLAEVSTALPHQEKVNFECDVPPGRFSFWERQTSVSNISISGSVHPKELRPATGWEPVANIALIQGEKTVVGRLRILAEDKDTDFSAWYQANPAQPGKGKLIGKLPKVARPIAVSVQLRGKALTFTAGNQSVSVEVPETGVSRVQLACSSGDFRFQDVIIIETP